MKSIQHSTAAAVHVMADKLNQSIVEATRVGITTALTQTASDGTVKVRTEIREILEPPLFNDRQKIWEELSGQDYEPKTK